MDGIFCHSASQPATSLRLANMATTVKMGWLPGARMGVSAARARKGQAQGVTTDNTSARARLQIDISQNLDTKSSKMPQKWGTDL